MCVSSMAFYTIRVLTFDFPIIQRTTASAGPGRGHRPWAAEVGFDSTDPKNIFSCLNHPGLTPSNHSTLHSITARSLGGGKSRWRRSSTQSQSQNAAFLQQGDRVLLVFLPSLDFILAFLGCLYAGLVPVPVFPPDPRRLRKDLYMFASIQASSRARVALTHRAYDHLKKARRRRRRCAYMLFESVGGNA